MRTRKDIIYAEEAYQIIGACFEVYKNKGCGFNEPLYQECLELELGMQKISFESQVQLPLDYKGIRLKQRFIPDLICFGKIIVELKAVSALCDEHRAQVLNYLNATGYKLGLLVNFGHHPKMQIERFAL